MGTRLRRTTRRDVGGVGDDELRRTTAVAAARRALQPQDSDSTWRAPRRAAAQCQALSPRAVPRVLRAADATEPARPPAARRGRDGPGGRVLARLGVQFSG